MGVVGHGREGDPEFASYPTHLDRVPCGITEHQPGKRSSASDPWLLPVAHEVWFPAHARPEMAFLPTFETWQPLREGSAPRDRRTRWCVAERRDGAEPRRTSQPRRRKTQN